MSDQSWIGREVCGHASAWAANDPAGLTEYEYDYFFDLKIVRWEKVSAEEWKGRVVRCPHD